MKDRFAVVLWDVDVTANALYRYFDDRDVLIAATADAVAHRLHIFIEKGMASLPKSVRAPDRVRKLLDTYARFARDNSALYSIFLNASPEVGAHLPEPRYHEKLWDQALSIIEPIVGERDAPAATVSMGGMVHGIWALQKAGVLGGRKPSEIDEYAFAAIIRGLTGG